VSALVERLRQLLSEPALKGIDPDSPEFTLAHRRILEQKSLTRAVFLEFYRRCRDADERYFSGCASTIRLELGSGGGMMKQVVRDVHTSDVKFLPFVDLIARGEELPFAAGSLRAIYAINVLHHLAEPRAFFRELVRTLAQGGGAILIEPYYGPVARFVFRRIFTSEAYEPEAREWSERRRDQPASGANQALSYVILRRDRARWEAEFPDLELVLDEPHTQISYVVSGGVNFRQLVPSAMGGAVARLESAVAPLDRWLALQHTVVIRRRGQSPTDKPAHAVRPGEGRERE
jgi:SAM-dependent methyltransferase